MTFRKKAILYYELEIFCIVMMPLCLGLIPLLGLGLSLLSALPFVVLLLANPKLYNEYITMNELGITCRKAGVQLWAYDWDSVACLKKVSRFRVPSVEVIAYNKSGNPEQYCIPDHYFQLGRAARRALRQYYKSEENSLK